MSKLLLFDDGFNLSQIPGLQLLALPNRDLATGWTSDNKVVQDYSQGGKVYGSELVVNGGFDSDSDWNKGIGWSISGGTASSDGSQSGVSYLYQGVPTSLGKKYRVEFTISSISSGNILFRAANSATGSSVGTARTAIGTYIEEIICEGFSGGIFFMQASSDFVGSIDNVSIKEITNGNHGLYRNSMELNQVAGRTFYRFDDTDDYIDYQDDLVLTNNFSVSMIFKTTDNTFALLSDYDFGSNQRSFQFIVSPDGKLAIYESPDGIAAYQRVIDNSTAYNTGGVNFVTWTKNGTVLKSYMNGVEKTVTYIDATTVASLYNSTAPLLSGARLNSGVPGYFGGWDKGAMIINSGILDLAWHKKIYNSAEIQRIMRGMA